MHLKKNESKKYWSTKFLVKNILHSFGQKKCLVQKTFFGSFTILDQNFFCKKINIPEDVGSKIFLDLNEFLTKKNDGSTKLKKDIV